MLELLRYILDKPVLRHWAVALLGTRGVIQFYAPSSYCEPLRRSKHSFSRVSLYAAYSVFSIANEVTVWRTLGLAARNIAHKQFFASVFRIAETVRPCPQPAQHGSSSPLTESLGRLDTFLDRCEQR